MPCPVGCRIQGQRAAGLRPQLRLVDVYDLLPCLGPRETSLGFSFLRFGLTYSLWFGPNPRAYEPPRTGLSPGLPTTAPTQLSYQGLYLRITTIRNSVKTVTKPGSVCVAAKHQSTEVCNRERDNCFGFVFVGPFLLLCFPLREVPLAFVVELVWWC